MRRRFLPLAAAFSMMAAAGDEQQTVAAREAVPAPNGETYDGGEAVVDGLIAGPSGGAVREPEDAADVG